MTGSNQLGGVHRDHDPLQGQQIEVQQEAKHRPGNYYVNEEGKLVRDDPKTGKEVVYKVTVGTGKNKKEVKEANALRNVAIVWNDSPLKEKFLKGKRHKRLHFAKIKVMLNGFNVILLLVKYIQRKLSPN